MTVAPVTGRPGALTVGIDPHLLVVFGGTGDLARRKLLPALYQLLEHRRFEDHSEVLAVATRELTDDEYRALAARALAEAGVVDAGPWCEEFLHYQPVTAGYDALARRITDLEAASSLPGNRAFYLAIPPAVFDDTIEALGKVGLADGPGWTRVVIEKPFGDDTASAAALNAGLHRWYGERQIYRIDHYLAKESVQNLLALRFANPVFESSWNRDRIDSVQITVAEDFGIGTRAAYFDRVGMIRDVVQNHGLQILSHIAMEPPVRLAPDAIRDEKVKVLDSTHPLDAADLVRGQYQAGRLGGQSAPGYQEEPGVRPGSETETFAAMRLAIDNWRWKGVPFYLRAGKRMATRLTEVAVVFKEPPIWLFEAAGHCDMAPNVLYVRLQPDEGFDLNFEMKAPGEGYDLHTQSLKFRYAEAFTALPGAYETLLADVLAGDQTLFVRSDEVEQAWRLIEPALGAEGSPAGYPAGSWGPAAADDLLARTDRRWMSPNPHR